MERLLTKGNILVVAFACSLLFNFTEKKKPMITKLVAQLNLGKNFPQPTNIESAYQFQFLEHVSTGLIEYDGVQYVPALAESWTIEDKTVTFNIKKNLKFSDGSSITPKDIESSFKNIIVSRTSTHYPIWEYLEDCENLKSIDDHCTGVQFIDDHTLQFKLKKTTRSFFVLLSSPETSIWPTDELKKEKFSPTVFSGRYSWVEYSENKHYLKANKFHFDYNESWPQSIEFAGLSPKLSAIDLVNLHKVDFIKKPIRLFSEDEIPSNYLSAKSGPLVINYLEKCQGFSDGAISSIFIKNFWKSEISNRTVPAKTFLFTEDKVNLTEEEFVSNLPESVTNSSVRIGVVKPYFEDGLDNLLIKAGKESGIEVTIVPISSKEFFLMSSHKSSYRTDLDFRLTPYGASEEYAGIQLRYMTPKGLPMPDYIKYAESLDYDKETVKKFKIYQKTLLQNQTVIPLYFSGSMYYYRDDLDISQTNYLEGSLDLWNVRAK